MIRIFGSLKDEPKIQSATALKVFWKLDEVDRSLSYPLSDVKSIKRNPEVATQPLFFGKIEGDAYEKKHFVSFILIFHFMK